MVKNLLNNARDTGSILRSRRSLEKEMANLSSILAWEILWTKKSGGLQSMGSKESDMTKAKKNFQTV